MLPNMARIERGRHGKKRDVRFPPRISTTRSFLDVDDEIDSPLVTLPLVAVAFSTDSAFVSGDLVRTRKNQIKKSFETY